MGKAIAAPFTLYGDRRFASVHEHLDVATGEQGSRLDERAAEVQERLSELQAAFAHLHSQVTTHTQVVAELGVAFRRPRPHVAAESSPTPTTAEPSHHELVDLTQRALAGDPTAEGKLAKLLRSLLPGTADQVVAEHRHLSLDAMGEGVASFLNWCDGHTGPAAQAGVWFNPPVTVLHAAGSVRANDVNERIVEIPYAMGVAASLPTGSRVLDVGAAESTVSLSMASLGLEVFAADLRPHPLEHPLLTPVVGPIESWEGPGGPLDAIFCISSIEHFGLGAYGEERKEGEERDDLGLDRTLIERCRTWLRPGGELVVTTPYGRWQVDDFQRVYDAEHLDALLEGWTILDRRVSVQTGRATWETTSDEPEPSTWENGARGVVLLRATPAP